MIEGGRISLLPDPSHPIIHHIMSLLPTRYAARTSVLSHKWYSFWSTFPVININRTDFPYREISRAGIRDCRERFIDCLQQTLSHRSMINLDMLSICTVSLGNSELYEILDRLVEAAREGKLKNLDLNIPSNVIHHINNGGEACEKCYKLPPVLFSLGESMLSLNLEGCDLVGYDENLRVKFLLLKTLSIRNTHVEGAFLEKVVRGSLAIESLELCLCHGLKKFTIAHKRMKKFVLANCKELDECKVDVPGLQSFEYTGYCILVDDENWNIVEFNLPNDAFMFPSLSYLSLTYVNTKAGTFNRMVSSFPMLKLITIKECEISGRSLLLGNELIKGVIEDTVFEEKLECRAANLETVTFIDSSNIFTINEKFEHLTSVSFTEINELTGSDIQLAVDSCPLLSSLSITSCNMLDSIKILSRRLESLVITDCVNVKEVRILAHKLIFLKYTGPVLKFSRLFASNKLVAEMDVKCDIENHEDLAQFQLAEFLQMFSRCADSIKLTCHCVEKTMYLELENSSTVEMEFRGHTRKEIIEQHNSRTMQSFVKDHLVEVKITSFAGLLDEFRLLRILICNAARLRKLSISIRKDSALATETQYRSEVISKIHNLRKASAGAEIIVEL